MSIAITPSAVAGNRNWLGNNGLWSIQTNWSPAFVPTVGDHAVFNTPTGYTVQLNGNKIVDVVDFTSGAGTFSSVGGGPWTLRMIAGTGLNLDAGVMIVTNVTLDCDQTASVEAELKLLGGALECKALEIGTTSTAGLLEMTSATAVVTGSTEIGSAGGNFGRLTVEGATAFFDEQFNTTLFNGEIYVGSGGHADFEALTIFGGAGTPTNATMTITGTGSEAMINDANFNIGNSAGPGTALVRILDHAALNLVHGVTIWPNGELEQLNGTFDGGVSINLFGGTWTRGSATSYTMNDAGYIVELTDGAILDWASENQFGSVNPDFYGEFIISEGSMADIAGPWSIGNDPGTYGRTRVQSDLAATPVRSIVKSDVGGDFADLIVGNYGRGELFVEGGSLCEFDDDFIIGAEANGSGMATITGVSNNIRSTVDVSSGGAGAEFIIGQRGSGSCLIEDGALVDIGGDVSLATQPLTIGTLFLHDINGVNHSQLMCGGTLSIGGTTTAEGGTSNVFVEDSAWLFASVGVNVWKNGAIYVSHGGFVFTSDITARGTVSVDRGGRIDANSCYVKQPGVGDSCNVGLNLGTGVPNTSTLDLSGSLYVGGDNMGSTGQGSCSIGAYGTIRTRGGRVWPNATLWLRRNVSTGNVGTLTLTSTDGFTNDGALYADGRIGKTTFSPVIFNNNGHVYPGIPITVGTLSITDINVNFNAGGTVHFDLAGTGAGEFDTMTFPGDGTINLGGTLNVNFINGFTPQLNDQFTIIPQSSPSSGDLVGAFSTVTGPAGYDFAQVIFPEHMVLIVNGVPCPADLAGNDGIVNVSDLFALLANWDTSGPGATLAPPNDIVNTSDLFALLAAWGTCP